MEPLYAELRERLRRRPGRLLTLPGLSLRESAVLVPLFTRGGVPHLLFTKRPLTLRQHPGQISFPGGGREASDSTPLHTALRETQEEIGLPPEQVEVLGTLDELPTVTQFRIAPFVGVFPGGSALRPNPEEIDLLLEVPLPALLEPSRHRTERHRVRGVDHEVHFFDYGPHVIWGATARILVNLLQVAGDLPALAALRDR